jgi:acetyl esterase/lipase
MLSLAAQAIAGSPPPPVMRWPDLTSRPLPVATQRVAYGQDPLQFADLWLPTGPGQHPLVIMIHGGCWQTAVAEAKLMNYLAEDLRARGVAVWNIEYRGIDRERGGYPGTFQDVANAADAVRGSAKANHLDLRRIVVVGHSAGGHLALWLAARPRMSAGSLLRGRAPLKVSTAISLGGLPDLEAAQTPPGDTCGADTVARLVGPPTASHPDIFADTSPAVMASPLARVILVNASRDPIAPPAAAAAYAARMAAKGPAPERHEVDGEGHVELIAPGSHAWELERRLILEAVKR